MKRTVYQCDRCGETADPPVTVHVYCGNQNDTGEVSAPRTRPVDYCAKCASYQLNEYTKNLSESDGRKLLSMLKSEKGMRQ